MLVAGLVSLPAVSGELWYCTTVLIICASGFSTNGIEISRKFQYLRGNFLDGNRIIYFDLNGNGIMQFI